MSVFASQPSFVAPPSYSRTKIQPPPYKASPSTPRFESINTTTSFNPIKTITRVFKNSSASASTASISLSSTQSTDSSNSTSSPPPLSPVSPIDRDQPSPSIPPPVYSPIKSAPRPSTSSPVYSIRSEPRAGSSINPRSDTFITSGQVIPGQSQALEFDDEAEEWEKSRLREERRRCDELDAREKEDSGCCARWWSVGIGPLPWAAYYVF